jgi:addiction module HigA family antidote
MNIKKNFRIAAHPGEVLQMLLDEGEISQSQLARALKEKHSKINEICKRKRGISAEMAVKLGRALGQSPDLWMGLQDEWDLAQVDESKYQDIVQIKLSA